MTQLVIHFKGSFYIPVIPSSIIDNKKIWDIGYKAAALYHINKNEIDLNKAVSIACVMNSIENLKCQYDFKTTEDIGKLNIPENLFLPH